MSSVNGTRFVRSNFARAPFGRDRERVAGARAVDLDAVEAVVAVHDVGAVAVVPDERVVAGAAGHGVAAAVADEAVVAAGAA